MTNQCMRGIKISRSSRSQLFLKKVALKKFANFSGKHLCWNLFLIKLQGFRPEIQHRCFPVKFTKLLRTSFLYNTSGGCFCMLLVLLLFCNVIQTSMCQAVYLQMFTRCLHDTFGKLFIRIKVQMGEVQLNSAVQECTMPEQLLALVIPCN